MVINKQLLASALSTVTFSNFMPSGTAQAWQLTSANTITNLGAVSFSGTSFSNSLPPQSITLFVVAAGGPPHLRAGVISPSNTFDFWLDGEAGQRYFIQGTTNFVNWLPVQTNTLTSNSVHVVISAGGLPYRFYRAQWTP
jgi:hypothetical protein